MIAPRTALVVDDSAAMRRHLVAALERLGLRTAEACNGADGWRRLQAGRFDLICTDVNMPLMDGLKLVSLVRAGGAHQATPIVVITTEGAEAMTKEAVKRGANNLVKKPFTPEQIKEKLASYFV